ncbi:MAG: hypothetical protein IPH24_08010 [Crocinitomicaceae bacterium]|nr:hypothetical protein [Crocinitomicaceae bacterium]
MQKIVVSNIENVDSQFNVEPFIGERTIEVTFSDLRFYPDQYQLGFWIGDKTSEETYDYAKNCINLIVTDGSALVKRNLPKNSGVIFLTPNWQIL